MTSRANGARVRYLSGSYRTLWITQCSACRLTKVRDHLEGGHTVAYARLCFFRHISNVPCRGAARGVISQLRVGQDLTRVRSGPPGRTGHLSIADALPSNQVSLPSVFLYPFSLLEVGGFRMLAHIDLLAEYAKSSSPLLHNYLHAM